MNLCLLIHSDSSYTNMVTRGKIISDIELRLTRGKVSDDFELSRRQIAFWVDEGRDEVVQLYLNTLAKKNVPIDPFFISREECKLVSTEDVPCIDNEDDCWERKITAMVGTPLYLHKDKGMILVTNSVGEEIHMVTHTDLQVLKHMRLSRPSQSKLVYHREGLDLIIDGLSKNYSDMPKIRVAYVRSIRNWDILDTEEYPISDSLVPELIDRIEEIARKELSKEGSEDVINDGTQA